MIKDDKKMGKAGRCSAILANDAPNCEFTHLNRLSLKFGIRFNHVSLHPVINRDWNGCQ
jgi:hypothetical protein